MSDTIPPDDPTDGLPDDMQVQLGAYEPADARRVIAGLEKENIPFEVEGDHSALQRPMRWLELYFAMNPEGSKLLIFVPQADLARADKIVERLFPL